MPRLLAPLLAVLSLFSTASAQEDTPVIPKVVFFDVNETLLDLEAMRSSVGAALGDREDLLPLWFSTMLHYSLVDTTSGAYNDFGDIGAAALLMVAKTNGITLDRETARKAIVSEITALPPHPDVLPALRQLKSQSVRMVSLTNSSNAGVAAQFENAGLTAFFERRLSVEDIEIYKPDARAYEWALRELGIAAEEAMLVAAHGWDVAGAIRAGMQTVFVARPGKALYPLAERPDHVIDDLSALPDLLAGAPSASK